jgi:hypothetical protein
MPAKGTTARSTQQKGPSRFLLETAFLFAVPLQRVNL